MYMKAQQSHGLHEKCFLDVCIPLSSIFSALSARETPDVSLPKGALSLITQAPESTSGVNLL